MTSKPKTHVFCIGHNNITFNIPSAACLIRTSRGFIADDVHQNLVSLEDVSEELSFYYPSLGGTAGLLAIPDIFSILKIPYSKDDRVMIFQQAKIVTPKPVGWASQSYPGMQTLTPILAAGLNIDAVVSAVSHDYLFPQPVGQRQGTLGFYAKVHHLPDYLRYFADAIEQEVLTSEEVVEMNNQKVLIPGGGLLGVFPLEYTLNNISLAKKVTFSFLKNFTPSPNDFYQNYAAGYCVERLCSYLLVKHLVSAFGCIPVEFIGNMLSVNKADYSPGSSLREL